MRFFVLSQILFAVASCLGGCSGGSGGASEAGTGGPGANETSAGIDLEATGSSSGGPAVETSDSSCALKVTDGCVGEVFEGEGVPLDIQIIFDQSGSMATVIDETTGETRMDAVYRALDAFSADTESIGLGVGLSFFGYMPIGATSCDPDDYDTAAVSIAPLPESADALLAALRGAAPTGETPTAAAIEGGCRLSMAHQAQNPGRAVVNLLVTDGEPKAPVTSKSTTCNPTLSEAVLAAQVCLNDGAGIPTYVLGVGPSLDNLNQIAAAGGTEHAYLVADDSSSGVLDALNQVRTTAQIPCEIPIDDTAEGLHYERTNVVTQDADCNLSQLTRVDSEASCDAGGFYFDRPDAPSTIVLCESTCGQLKQPRTKLLYAIGCGIEEVK